MTAKYSAPSVASILEDPEDEPKGEIKPSDNSSPAEDGHPHAHTSQDTSMRTHSGRERERERSRRVHKPPAVGGRPIAKPRSRTTGVQRAGGLATRDNGVEGSRRRHRRSLSNKSHSSTSESSSDEEEPPQDHRAVLAAARARLSSPSTISAFTTLTTSTNKSSGSSGSNSTVTQASITKRSAGKKPEEPEVPEVPLSPAVPDPPNVFAFLDKDGSPEPEDEDEDHQEGHEEEGGEEEGEEEEYDPGEGPSNWASRQPETAFMQPPLPTDGPLQNGSASSSPSSSFHGDDTFSQPADHDTDRSTSPERSVKGKHEARDAPAPPPTDRVSAKIAAQMAAAQQRQNLYGSMQQFGTPSMPRGNYQLPVATPSVLSARYHQQIKPHALPRAEKIPVTGYELLASRLSYSSTAEERGEWIRPIYRKFEALNHRLLLHLQDEISELEEQLHRLDNADTQSRRTDRFIVPASRRAAAHAGGELQWHKTDILGRIGYKLNQYNQALASFNSTQALAPPDPEDIEYYRSYLQTEHPIAEPETHFLDPADDLVSICSDTLPRQPFQLTSGDRSYDASSSMISSSDIEVPHHSLDQGNDNIESKSPLFGLAAAVAASILIPILTFNVIPNFIGRLTVTLLVALFATFGLIQSGILDQGSLFRREGCVSAGIYGGVMAVIAGVMS